MHSLMLHRDGFKVQNNTQFSKSGFQQMLSRVTSCKYILINGDGDLKIVICII